jgi:multidrug resistance efflux pump
MSSQLSPNKIGAWLRPAAALMQRLRMPVKLATMSLLLIVPLVAVTIAQVNRLTQDYRTAQKEALGAQAVSLVTGIVTEVQHHRVESML